MSASAPRTPFFERLPEIYRIRDAEQFPPDQFKAYLRILEVTFGAIHENIEALYHDLFIETCDDWVIPYIADLLGTSHLQGEARTLRADVADTIALRRRKGTLGAIERLAANLTGWAARSVELRENLVWTQHLNHQRPDVGGTPPHAYSRLTRFFVPRGGTVPVRDPAMLSSLGGPFSPFAHTADVKPATSLAAQYNLPNLAIFLWRLAAYRVRVTRPVDRTPSPPPPLAVVDPLTDAAFAVRFDLHPLGRPVRLFNTYRADPYAEPARLAAPDEVPGPISPARITTPAPSGLITDLTDAANPALDARQWTGQPGDYVNVDVYTPGVPPALPTGIELGDGGLQLFLPAATFGAITDWRFRGDNLCAWETGLRRRLGRHEIVIDPDIGRVLIGVDAAADVAALRASFLAGYTYGAVGEIGAHPIDRSARPETVGAEPDGQMAPSVRTITAFSNANALRDALTDVDTIAAPVLIEIQDSLVHDLDLNDALLPTMNEDGGPNLLLGSSLVIRAADGHRPIVRLIAPLRFRPTLVRAPVAANQPAVDAAVRNLLVRFEGVHVVAGPAFAGTDALVMRAAVARLELIDCTFDPGGWRERQTVPSPQRAALRRSLHLAEPYGFADPLDEDAFLPTPDVVIQRSICGALHLDEGYALTLEDSIVDAGCGPDDPAGTSFALTAATNPATAFSAPLVLTNVTFFGRVRATSARGQGGIFCHRLTVFDHQNGCLKYCWFSGDGDVLPQNYACVDGDDARLEFTSTWFADPGYAQLSLASDSRILTRGPHDDAMGATNFLLAAHKWTNLQIRLREFMPLGVRPIVVAVT
jgi:hypothetical protein